MSIHSLDQKPIELSVAPVANELGLWNALWDAKDGIYVIDLARNVGADTLDSSTQYVDPRQHAKAHPMSLNNAKEQMLR